MSESVEAAFSEHPALCEQHLACGCTIGFQDAGMHTSAPAMHSTLPATALLDNDMRKAQLQRKMRRSLPPPLSLPHSFSPSFPLFSPTLL